MEASAQINYPVELRTNAPFVKNWLGLPQNIRTCMHLNEQDDSAPEKKRKGKEWLVPGQLYHSARLVTGEAVKEF